MFDLRSKRSRVIAGGVALFLLIGIIATGVWLTVAKGGSSTIRIPELGIQMTVPDSIKDLKYQTFTIPLKDGRLETIAGFSTATLIARDRGCSLDDMPVGSLGKVLGQYPTDDLTADSDYGVLVKQFPTFFIVAGRPQGACSSNADTQGLASAAGTAFQRAQSSIQPLQ